jgi:hypothetical protein
LSLLQAVHDRSEFTWAAELDVVSPDLPYGVPPPVCTAEPSHAWKQARMLGEAMRQVADGRFIAARNYRGQPDTITDSDSPESEACGVRSDRNTPAEQNLYYDTPEPRNPQYAE